MIRPIGHCLVTVRGPPVKGVGDGRPAGTCQRARHLGRCSGYVGDGEYVAEYRWRDGRRGGEALGVAPSGSAGVNCLQAVVVSCSQAESRNRLHDGSGSLVAERGIAPVPTEGYGSSVGSSPIYGDGGIASAGAVHVAV